MSNPYDPQNPNQGEQPSPYGAPIPSGGGGGYGGGYGAPYGQQNPYGNEMPKKTDAVSITGFVLSLTCCLSLVGAILGGIGLGRTKGGKRKGRWAAISALVVGILGTLAFAGIVIALVFVIRNTVTPGNAEVGECVDVDGSSDSGTTLTRQDCSEEHDAEVVLVGERGDTDFDLNDPQNFEEVCAPLMDPADVEAVDNFGTELEYGLVIEDNEDESDDDRFLCFVEPVSGNLNEAVLP